MAGVGEVMNFSGVNWGLIGMIVLWGFVALLIGLVLGGLLYIFIIKSNQLRIIEINMVTKKIRQYPASKKRNRSHNKQLYIKKLKKFLPNVQQKDVYQIKGKDTIILLVDNNGLYHTARLPNIEEFIEWCKYAKKEDLTEVVETVKANVSSNDLVDDDAKKKSIIDKIKEKFKGTKLAETINTLTAVYLEPNPMENIEWLADEQNQADSSFKTGILKHPALVWLGTLTILAMLTVIWLVIMKVM